VFMRLEYAFTREPTFYKSPLNPSFYSRHLWVKARRPNPSPDDTAGRMERRSQSASPIDRPNDRPNVRTSDGDGRVSRTHRDDDDDGDDGDG